jgi:hypothetical protein
MANDRSAMTEALNNELFMPPKALAMAVCLGLVGWAMIGGVGWLLWSCL